MKKRILSIWLSVCMVLTLLPISAMAAEVNIPIGASGEIIAFAPLAETEISVSTGTAIEDLGLPESLTATVRTAVTAGTGTSEEAVQDSGNPDNLTEATPGSATPTDSNGQTETNEMTEPEWNVTTPDIPVTWTSAYDMDTEGIYVFTPVIEDYFVSAALPEITVTVGTAKRQMQRTAFGVPATFSVGINTMLEINALPIYGDPDVDMMGNPRHGFTKPTDGSKTAELYLDSGSLIPIAYGDITNVMTSGAGSTIYFYATNSGAYLFTATFIGDDEISHDYPIAVTVTDGGTPASNPTKSIADSNLYFKDNSGDTQYSTDNTTWTSYTGDFTITGSSTSDTDVAHTVIVQSGTHNITLSGCSIGAATDTGTYFVTARSPFDIQGGMVNLTLMGDNKLYSAHEGKAGLHVNPGAGIVVTAESTGSLDARCRKQSGAYYGRGAGIGGDNTQASGAISIYGGEVTAYSYHGAGIGSGYNYKSGTFGDIRITGGTVVAQSDNGNGIGLGNANTGTVGNVTITGGSVNAYGKTSPIGGTLKNDKATSVQLYTLALSGVSAPTAVAALSTTPELDYVYGTSGMKTDGDGRLYVYLPTGKTAVSVTAGGVTYSGSVTSYAATLTPAAPAEPTYGAFTVTGNDLSGVNYNSGVLTVSSNAVVTIVQTGGVATPTTDRIEVTSAANITLDGVNIDVSGTENAAALKITSAAGAVNLTIADGSVNTLKSGNYCAGLQKDTTAAGTMLTITGTGTLNATGGSRGAGIGGTAAATGGGTAGSYITVSGGTVTATGGYLAAGIGGGGDKSGSTTNYGGGSGSHIAISGGTVTANGGYWSAGIGGGSGHNYQAGGSGSHITISGGTVTATGGQAAAGIGAGTGKWGGATDNIIISGGSIQTASIWCTPTNGQETSADVKLYTLTVMADASTTLANTAVTALTATDALGYAYGMTDVKTNGEGKLYVYLPAGKTAVSATAGSVTYSGSVTNDAATLTPQAQWGVAGSGGGAPTSWVNSGTLADAMTYANSNSGAYIQLLTDIGSSNHSTWPLTFNSGKTTILDLNGKDINRGLTKATANGNVITVNGNLTVKDSSETDVSKQGRITEGYSDNTDTGGGVYVSGNFTLQDGNITGNKTTGWGGGVRVQYGVGASFIMRGGSITSNDAGNEGAVYAAGATFEMTGGSITGNKCPNNGRGAINVGSTGTFTVGGTAVISGNIAGESTVRNVRVYSDSPIRISTDMPLTSGAYIGVTANSVPTSGSPVNVTGTNSNDYSSYFHSDNSSYMIQNGADNKVQLAVPVPAIGTLEISNVFTAGNSLTLTALDSYKPTITTNGVTITAQGWQQHNPNSGGYWETLSGGIIPDTGSAFTLRYYATYSGGTVYSNAVTLNVVGNTTSLALTASPEGQQVAGNSVTLTATLTGFFAGAGVNGQTVTFKNGETTLGTASLNAGGVAAYTWTPGTETYSLTAEYAATAYNKAATSSAVSYTVIVDPNIAAVAAAKTALVDGSVNVAFGADQTAKTAAVQAYVNGLLTGDAAGVTATVTYNNGTGKYDVAISKGSVNDSKSLSMTVNVAPDPDIAIVAGAKTAAQDVSYSNMTQAAATDENAIETVLKNTAATAVNNSDITITINKVSHTAPIAGTSANPGGTNGSSTFTVTVSKGTQSETTTQITITITATPYTGITDAQAVAAAKTALVDGTVNVASDADQTAKTAAVQAYVNGLLTGDAAGVTATVTYNNGTGKYDVAISKGSVNDSKSLSMTVNVAPDPDIAIVAGAKTAAQDVSYSNMTQAAATDENAIETVLKNTAATAVNNSDITITINKVSYTAPIAGTSANPGGTNGSYTFTVTVSKGTQSETTTQITITITATPYTGITDAQAVAAAKTALVDGSVNVAFGADQTAKTAAVKAYVNGLLTGDAAGVIATVTYNNGTGKYDVAISKGSVNDSKSLSMTVNVAPDSDIAIVAGAKTAAQDVSYSNMTQAAATDENAIETVLKNTAATAVNNSDITITINKVSHTAPIAGTSANPGGTNGGYTFTVTVSKGTQSETTTQITITITATPYTGITDAQAVAAAKTALVDGTVNVASDADQTAKTAAVKAYVNAMLTGDAAGVTATVTYNSETGKYDVAISKGSENDSKSLSMTVNVASDSDVAIVAGAKTAAQDASYANMTQTAATDESAIKAALKNTVETAVGNSGVTVAINEISYTAPIAGTSANPSGTNGSYTFTVTVSKGTQSETTTQITITITATPYTGGTGGGGSNGGGSTTPPSTKPTEPVTGSTENKATVDNKGNASVSLTDKNITDAIADAKAEAAKKGVNAGDITAVIHVTTGGKNADTVTVNLPKTTQEQVISNKITSVQLVIDRPDLTIGLDLAAVTEINRQAKADVQLLATRMDNSKLSGDAKAAIGNRPTYDLKATYGSGKSVTDFGKGSVSVEIPYILQKGEIAGNIYAVYVDAKGKVTYLTDSSYDAKRGTVVFSARHFSTYSIAYKARFKFTDISGHWAKDDILFAAGRGLMVGTGNTKFKPNGSMTRGMIVTVLGRLANADISAYKQSSFTDVKADAYYMGYIEWSVKNDILVGIGGGKFNPGGLVTREQLAVIMDRYAAAIGFKLPEVHAQNVFVDNAKIGAWAAPSVKRIQMAGIIQGKSNNLYDPQGTATRAEVSAVLHRFVELAIFSGTAQGWTMNDSGKWMYYENGKPVTGKKKINGSIYTFDQYGVTVDVPKNLR